jgi:hypothetical protein
MREYGNTRDNRETREVGRALWTDSGGGLVVVELTRRGVVVCDEFEDEDGFRSTMCSTSYVICSDDLPTQACSKGRTVAGG